MALTLGRTRIRVHPLALMFPLAAAMLGSRQDAAALLLALAAHESAHLLAARGLGVAVSQLRLMPFGGAIAMENPYALPPSHLLGVAAAGPLGSGLMLLTAAALAHWRALSPAFALDLMRVNLALMLFNLLPALPLDGGRMLYALLSPRLGRERAAELGIRAGRAVALALLALTLGFALKWRRVNLSFVFAAVFMLASAADERRALADTRARAMLGALRPVNRPVAARFWAVGADCGLREALRVARPGAPTLFAVYSGSRLTSITDDRRLLKAALKRGYDARVGEAVTARPPRPGTAS